MIHQSHRFFTERPTGEMVSRVVKDLNERGVIRADKRKIYVLDRQSMGRRSSVRQQQSS